MGERNGKPKYPKATLPKANPSTMNGQPLSGTTASRRCGRKGRRSSTGWVLDKALKMLVWYSIITLAFRCPQSLMELQKGSPRICRPSLQVKAWAWPYFAPHYDRYLGPYMQKAQPYVNQLQEKVYKPGLAAYQQYAAPRVADAQQFGQVQWERTVKPQLEVAREQAGKQYDATLGPHIKKIQGAVHPYYSQVSMSARDIWELELQPAYQNTAPYAKRVYDQGQDFAVHTALPQAQYAGSTLWAFWARQIWPRVRVLYGENVEPQLNRITERLGRYKDGRKLEAEIKSIESSSKANEASSTISSILSSMSSTAAETADSPLSATSAAASSITSEPTSESTVSAAEQLQEDLKNWETICAKAVDEGADDLRERIQEISSHQINSQAQGVGDALVIQLEETVNAVLSSLKGRIQSVVSNLPEDADTEQHENATEELTKAIRAAGQSVKGRAQALRDWRSNYDAEIDSLVDKALQSTLETIDGIRELRLTEIGRRYATADLPHKEWSKYNDAKRAVQSWRNDVEKIAKQHQSIAKAKEAGEETESRGMDVTEATAKELGRLKEVAKWKIAAADASDNFDTKQVPPVAERVRQRIVDAVEDVTEAVMGTSEQGSVESAMSHASAKASDVVGNAPAAGESISSRVSEAINSDQPVAESLMGKIKSSASSAASAAYETIFDSERKAEDAVNEAKKSASSASSAVSATVGVHSGISDRVTDATSAISDAVVGSKTPAVESISSSLASEATDRPRNKSLGPKAASILAARKAKKDTASRSATSIASDASTSASSSVGDAASSLSSATSMASDTTSSLASEASSTASTASRKVFAGANAQILVEAREPILDDVVDGDASYSERVQSMANVAMDQANALTQAVADAMKVTASTQGTIESMTSLASEQYESAIAAASGVLFGPGVMQQGSSVAREQYLSAVTAASYAIYGTPAPAAALSSATSAAEDIAAAANSQYNAAVSEALAYYEAAKTGISQEINGPPKPQHKKMLQSLESAYSDSVAAASQKLQAALGSLPTQVAIGNKQGAIESVSSIASMRLAEGLSAASAQYKSAKLAVGIEPTPVHQEYLASAQAAYYQGIGMAHDRYSSFLDAASSAVGVTPTTGYESYLAAAQTTYSAAIAAASSNMRDLLSSASSVVGATTHSPAQSYLNQISSQYDAAIAAASSQFIAASSQASEVIYGRETPAYEALASRASENWEALVSTASDQIYGAPPPFTDVVVNKASDYAAQATEVAASHFAAVQALLSELVVEKEPVFAESVMSRLHSAYSTGAPAVTSSAASVASDAYASASSAVSALFQPPPSMDGFMDRINQQINEAVDAASSQIYGTTKGAVEHATEAAANAYSDAASHVSEAVYGRETGYAEAVQSSMSIIASSASAALSEAIYGSPTGTIEAAQNSAASVFSSLTSVAAEQARAVSASASKAVYSEEKGYVESMQAQISEAMASARSRVAELEGQANSVARDSVSAVSEAVVDAASSVSSAASQVTDRVRDEL